MLGGEFLRKADRWGSWALLIIVLAFVLTGFGMTRHLMDPALANFVHTRILPPPLFVLLLVHVFRPVRGLLKGWKVFSGETALDLYTWALALILGSLFFFVYLRQK